MEFEVLTLSAISASENEWNDLSFESLLRKLEDFLILKEIFILSFQPFLLSSDDIKGNAKETWCKVDGLISMLPPSYRNAFNSVPIQEVQDKLFRINKKSIPLKFLLIIFI